MGQRIWRQAERDLEAAQITLQPGSYYVAANLAHQAAEKALKAAYWHVRGEEPPWTHDLGKCAERVADRIGEIPHQVDIAIEYLEPMFERSRYPSGRLSDLIPAELIGEDDARAAVAFAKEIIAWVEVLLRQERG